MQDTFNRPRTISSYSLRDYKAVGCPTLYKWNRVEEPSRYIFGRMYVTTTLPEGKRPYIFREVVHCSVTGEPLDGQAYEASHIVHWNGQTTLHEETKRYILSTGVSCILCDNKLYVRCGGGDYVSVPSNDCRLQPIMSYASPPLAVPAEPVRSDQMTTVEDLQSILQYTDSVRNLILADNNKPASVVAITSKGIRITGYRIERGLLIDTSINREHSTVAEFLNDLGQLVKHTQTQYRQFVLASQHQFSTIDALADKLPSRYKQETTPGGRPDHTETETNDYD